MMPTSRCQRCGLAIGWVATINGKRMPIDPEPNDLGNVFVRVENGKYIAIVRSGDQPTPTGIAFMPHFATCPAVSGPAKQRKEPPRPADPEPPIQPTLDLTE